MSIRSRLTLLYSVILALILVAFGIVLYVVVSNITYDSAASSLRSEVSGFAAVVAHPDPDHGGISIMPPPNSSPPELYTEIRQVNGAVIYRSPALQAAHADLPLDPGIQQQIQQGSGPSQQGSGPSQQGRGPSQQG